MCGTTGIIPLHRMHFRLPSELSQRSATYLRIARFSQSDAILMYPWGGDGSWKKSCLEVSFRATRPEMGMCVAICWMISVGSAVKSAALEK